LRENILKLQVFLLGLFSLLVIAWPQDWYSGLSEEQREYYDEHLRFGQPDNQVLLIRNAFVLHHNSTYRIPNWVTYHIDPDYLNVPERTGRFSCFRTDDEVEDPVEDEEYDGLFDSKGYARGHLAPYKIMGGDRDIDGEYATYGRGVTSDADDELTIFQGNYLTNIVPQHHSAINGPGGLWYKLERWIQDVVVAANQREVWVYAGGIVFDTEHTEGVGKNDSIVVPNLFYKIVITDSGNINQPYILAFLFPHFKSKADVKETNIFKYLVTVDYIEAITGLDFFKNIDTSDQEVFEGQIEIEPWTRYIRD